MNYNRDNTRILHILKYTRKLTTRSAEILTVEEFNLNPWRTYQKKYQKPRKYVIIQT